MDLQIGKRKRLDDEIDYNYDFLSSIPSEFDHDQYSISFFFDKLNDDHIYSDYVSNVLAFKSGFVDVTVLNFLPSSLRNETLKGAPSAVSSVDKISTGSDNLDEFTSRNHKIARKVNMLQPREQKTNSITSMDAVSQGANQVVSESRELELELNQNSDTAVSTESEFDVNGSLNITASMINQDAKCEAGKLGPTFFNSMFVLLGSAHLPPSINRQRAQRMQEWIKRNRHKELPERQASRLSELHRVLKEHQNQRRREEEGNQRVQPQLSTMGRASSISVQQQPSDQRVQSPFAGIGKTGMWQNQGASTRKQQLNSGNQLLPQTSSTTTPRQRQVPASVNGQFPNAHSRAPGFCY